MHQKLHGNFSCSSSLVDSVSFGSQSIFVPYSLWLCITADSRQEGMRDYASLKHQPEILNKNMNYTLGNFKAFQVMANLQKSPRPHFIFRSAEQLQLSEPLIRKRHHQGLNIHPPSQTKENTAQCPGHSYNKRKVQILSQRKAYTLALHS